METKSLGPTLVTGATGLLGAELVEQLLASRAAEPIVCLIYDTDPRSRFYTEKLSERVVCVAGDIRKEGAVAELLARYDIRTVFHLAAQTQVEIANEAPEETFDTNIRGTWLLLEAIRLRGNRVKAVVVASSDKAYGQLAEGAYREDSPLNGRFAYDVSKSCCDLLAQAYLAAYHDRIVITRCGNLYGPGDLNPNRIVPSTIRSLAAGEAPRLRSDGTFVRDYLYVGDAAAAYVFLATRLVSARVAPGAYNISYEKPQSVLDVVARISALMGKHIAPTILDTARGEIRYQALSCEKLRACGWKATVGFDEGLRRAIAWYTANPAALGAVLKRVA